MYRYIMGSINRVRYGNWGARQAGQTSSIFGPQCGPPSYVCWLMFTHEA